MRQLVFGLQVLRQCRPWRGLVHTACAPSIHRAGLFRCRRVASGL